MKLAPTFPPLLKGHRLSEGKKPVSQALAMLAKGKLGAGDVLWSEDQNNLNFALVLEPEVIRERCGEMIYLLMVAFGDAVGAISAPEIAVTYSWPSGIMINEASVGKADLYVSEDDAGGIPQWMIASLEISIRPSRADIDPGNHADRTTMWDEGCGDISRTELLESVSRHVVNWIHRWGEEGFKPVHDQWMGRISEKRKLVDGIAGDEFFGMDEVGNALLKTRQETVSADTLEALVQCR